VNTALRNLIVKVNGPKHLDRWPRGVAKFGTT
jgi:hypothetical protein